MSCRWRRLARHRGLLVARRKAAEFPEAVAKPGETPSSTTTTVEAAVSAARKAGIINGKVSPIPSSAFIRPQTRPRIQG